MNNDIQDVIQQADLLIKEGKFKSAWKLLLPYQKDPAARKRLVWLDQKRKQAQPAEKQPNPKAPPRRRNRLYLFIALIAIVGVSSAVIYGLSQRGTVVPTVTASASGEATQIIAAPTVNVPASPVATDVPPTEDAQEVDMQQQLREWFVTVEGVNSVLSLDVDLPTDGPPLVYAEIVVAAGHNVTRIPEEFVQKLNATLNTTQYSDFVIIINDEQRIVEYKFDPANSTWEQTELSSSVAATPEPDPEPPTATSGG